MPWYRMRGDAEPGYLAGRMFHLRGDRRMFGPPCSVCGYFGFFQCDWRVPMPPHADSVTCDAWLCKYCTTRHPGDRDLCPQHELAYRAWLARRTNSTDGEG